MPYIEENRRLRLDDCIAEMVNCLDGGRYNTDSFGRNFRGY